MTRHPKWLSEKGNVFCHITGIPEIGEATGTTDWIAQGCHWEPHLSALPFLASYSMSGQKQLAPAVPSIMSRHGNFLKTKGYSLSCAFLIPRRKKTTPRSPLRKLALISHQPEMGCMLFPNSSLASWVELLFDQSRPCLELGVESVFLDVWGRGRYLRNLGLS